jgi:hypothetical protein
VVGCRTWAFVDTVFRFQYLRQIRGEYLTQEWDV